MANPKTIPESLLIDSPPVADELPIERPDYITGCVWFVLFSCGGVSAGAIAYPSMALVAEHWVIPVVEPPIHAYGQQAGLISLPLSSLLGLFAGVACAMFVVGLRWLAAISMFLISFMGAIATLILWSNDGIGVCNSAIVLYYPLFAFCGLIGFAGIAFAGLSFLLKTPQLPYNNALDRSGSAL